MMEGDLIWGCKDSQVPDYFNFADVIDKCASEEKNGEKESHTPALWWVAGEGKEVRWSFQDLASNSKRAANVLCTAANIRPGDRVLVIVRRIPEYWLMQLACLRTGAVFVPIPVSIGPKEFHRRIQACNPSCFVAGGGDIETDLLTVIDQFSSSPHGSVKCRLIVNRMKQTNRPGWLSFEELFQEASNEHKSFKSLSSTPMSIIFTSGTTGKAKMVEHSQGAWNLENPTSMASRGLGVVQSDFVWYHCSTGWTLLISGSFTAWSVGAGFFVHYKNLTAREALETLQTFPITFLFFLPRMYTSATKEDLKSFHFPKLSSCITTCEPMNKDAMFKWKEVTGLDIRDVYGQTEVGALCCTSRDGKNRVGSVGKACTGLDVAIIDDINNNNYQELPPGKIGMFVVRVKPDYPVGFFTRYVDEPEKTAARFSGEFYITGDLGYKDNDGYFWFVGRTDDMIVVDGDNINRYDVENCLTEHPAVLECAVVSSPDPLRQVVMKAFVVVSNGFKNTERDAMMKDLQNHVTKRTAGWMCPSKMEFVDALPTTLSGKINRKELEQREWKSIPQIEQ
ncbi:acyl-coenzyme A synthetase ACSM4, mitochondrial-like isoform X2 [Oculina patagonica]